MHNNILIVGGAGFIGSCLTKYYINNTSSSITVVDININNHIDGRTRYYNSFNNLNIEQFDCIYYLAASVGVKSTSNNPSYTIHNNIYPLNCLLEKIIDNNVDFLFTSSSEVYGESVNNTEDSNLIVKSPSLRWTYAATKIMNEFMIRSELNNSRIVRLFNIVGPGQNHNTGMVLPSFIYNAVNNLPLKIYNSGLQVRTFCYVEDCVDILFKLMNNKNTRNNIYNIGADNKENSINILDLAKLVIKLTNSKSDIINISAAEDLKLNQDDYDDIKYRVPDITKLRTLFNNNINFMNLEDIIKNIIISNNF